MRTVPYGPPSLPAGGIAGTGFAPLGGHVEGPRSRCRTGSSPGCPRCPHAQVPAPNRRGVEDPRPAAPQPEGPRRDRRDRGGGAWGGAGERPPGGERLHGAQAVARRVGGHACAARAPSRSGSGTAGTIRSPRVTRRRRPRSHQGPTYGWCAGGQHAVGECLGDRGSVLGGADRGTREGAGVGVDEQLQVDGEALAVEHDGQLGAVSDPLGAGVEGQEAPTVRRGVGRTASLVGDPHAVGLEDVLDVLASEGDAKVVTRR